jgi:DNA repair photolyase
VWVRWDNLSIADGDDEPTLPVSVAGAVARTFDTPDFRGMTFYEVRAKSIINRVPSASRVPFEWTLNPYRGCTHACVYCLGGETPILMANGRTRQLADIRVGDRVYGTVQRGRFRRYEPTDVLAHWSTIKPAYRVTLRDGTLLVASGDHRLLTDRGWRYVTGREWGGARRPYLGRGSRLLGTGQFADPPDDTPEYRRGYLCGVIRTDGHVGALVGGESLERVRSYLDGFHVADTESRLQDAGHSRRAMTAIRQSGRLEVRTFTDLVRWPAEPTDDWRKGFLAGVFDAEGTYCHSVLRIAHTDHEMIKQSADCLRSLGFDVVADAPAGGGSSSVHVRGGLPEHFRFFHTVDPAIVGKRTVDGTAVMARARLAVASVEPLRVELPMFDITTGTGDFIANGVVSHNCFARNTHTYLDLDAGRDFDTRVVVKVNTGELLRRELAAPRWRSEHIAMGSNVDCYQRAEGRYRLMRDVIAALRDFANPFSILTKGTLILRDLDLLTQAAEVTGVGLSMSIGFIDEKLWRSVEPGTPSPRRRLDAVRQLSDAGFPVGVLMAPILPGITDTPESIDDTVRAIAGAGAASVVPIGLHLRTGAREWYLRWLARERPDLLPRYRELYGDRAYLGTGYQREVAARVRLAARRHGLHAKGANTARQMAARSHQEQPTKPSAEQPAEQLTLL